MINAILTGVMNLIIGLVQIILAPIDALIQTLLPDVSSGLSAVGAMFNLALQYVGFAIDLTGLSSETISLIILFFTFKLTAPLAFRAIKTAIKWYDKIKP